MESTAFKAVADDTTKLAEELTTYGGRPVTIELRNDKETQNVGSTGRNATKISLNVGLLDRVRQDDHKRVIWRGLAYHQLLNALSPSDAQHRTALKEGFGPLFTLLSDEQNERQATAKDVTLGAAFQTVCSYVYTSKNRKRGDALALGGEVQKTPTGNEVYNARLNEFAFHLRRRLAVEAGVTDPTVIEASELIPTGLKDLSKDEVLVLARQIHERLARGVTLSKANLFEPIAALTEPEGDGGELPVEDPGEEEADELEGLSPIDSRWWQIVFKSKWSYITLGAFVVGWLIIALSVGIDFWRAVIIFGVAGTVLVGGLLGVVALLRKRGERDEDTQPRPKSEFWKRFWAGLRSLWPFSGEFEFGNKLARAWNGFWGAVGRGWKSFKRGAKNLGAALGERLEKCWRTPLARHLRTSVRNLCVNGWNWTVRTSYLAWRNPTVRLAIIALPIAILLAIVFAIVSVGAELVLWQLILLVAAWFAVVALGWFFREKIKNFLIADLYSDEEVDHDVEATLPKDKKTLTFGRITATQPVDADPNFLSRSSDEVEDAARRLQSSLERVGIVNRERDNQEEGFDLIEDIEQVFLGQTELCVDEDQVNRLALNVQVVVDCSQSQADPTKRLKRGEKLARSKKFALAIERALVGKRRASCNLWGYNDTTIFDCGRAGQGRVSGLKASGGNNDAAALQYVSTMAQGGADTVKLLVLISDDQPADCSWGALNELGRKLLAQGFVIVLVVVDNVDDPSLPWNVVDLHTKSLDEAATSLGHVIEARLAKG